MAPGYRRAPFLLLARRAALDAMFCLRSSQQLAAGAALRTVHDQTVPPERIRIGFPISGHAEKYRQRVLTIVLVSGLGNGNSVFFPVFHDLCDGVRKQRRKPFPFALIEHVNMLLAAPAILKF